VEVPNPYAVPLPIGALGYELTSGGRSLARGSTADGASLPARSRRVVPITVQLAFSDVLATLSDIRPGALVPWEAAIDVSVEAPVLGTLHLPLQTKGELPVPAVPEVSLASMRWNELTFETARATLSLDVLNTNAFPIDLRELSFGLALAGRDVADARVTSAGSTAAGDTARLSVPVSFSPLQLGLSAMNLLGGAAAAYTLDGTLDLGTPFGTLGTPFLRAGQVPFLR
jgi:LEA14-like dessication related protein